MITDSYTAEYDEKARIGRIYNLIGKAKMFGYKVHVDERISLVYGKRRHVFNNLKTAYQFLNNV